MPRSFISLNSADISGYATSVNTYIEDRRYILNVADKLGMMLMLLKIFLLISYVV